MAETPSSDRQRELIRQIDALERKLRDSGNSETMDRLLQDHDPGLGSGRGATAYWPPLFAIKRKTNVQEVARTIDPLMSFPPPISLLLPPHMRGLGPAGTINQIADDINLIHENHQLHPAQQAAKNMTGSARGVITHPLEPYEDSTKEAKFQTEYRTLAVRSGIDPNPDNPMHKYDYRRAWEAGAMNTKDGHFPSEFKLPGHPRIIVDGRDTRTGRQVRNAQTKRRFR